MASLLHDDVLDDADTRRGIGSLNFVMGNKVSCFPIIWNIYVFFCSIMNLDDRICTSINVWVLFISFAIPH